MKLFLSMEYYEALLMSISFTYQTKISETNLPDKRHSTIIVLLRSLKMYQ